MLPNCPPKTLCGSSLMALAQSFDLATPCNHPCRCWQQGLRPESVEKICQFLYDLTLQKFSRIMNPKMSGWNIYRVPLVQSYTCDLYDGIFDRSGNLRRLLSHSSRLGSRSPSIGKSERRYYGAQVPVLMHEPFDSQKPWTWQRRHPQQARVLQDGRMGNTKIHRYKRKSIQQEYDNLKQRYSLHSTFTNGSGSIGTAPMFGTPQSMGFVMLKPNYNRNSDPIKLQKRKIRR
ncbi:uncharacterized protein Dwil_GK21120 [Drosophila willistoni]|uniref:Uncharacterized protein n=1 Tax=Drosophila willistoni TaxID=7260 RepID=A0A0Q9WT15_DROWI|nr:uncharacterized protein Dwil_GK21120 [Drosophila willistoni]